MLPEKLCRSSMFDRMVLPTGKSFGRSERCIGKVGMSSLKGSKKKVLTLQGLSYRVFFLQGVSSV